MAYFDGDMDAEQMPVVDRMDAEYTIYVNNLPPELNENAIRQLFGNYGEITSMFYPRNATWTYITYGKFGEAESAIRELNNKKPLYLKVTLAKERSSKMEELQILHVPETSTEGPKVERATTSTDQFINSDTKYQQSMGRGRPLDILRKHITTPYKSVDESFVLSQTHNVCETEEPFVNTNRLWTRGVITVTADGKRHVSLGRGYTFYEYPEEDSKIEEYIAKVYEKRYNGSYEYAPEKPKNEAQKCLICSIKTVKHCEKCYTYYCSRICQVKDWPRHQAECQRMPALVEEVVNDISSLKIDKDKNQAKVTSTSSAVSKTIPSNDVKLRRPNVTQAESSNSMTTDNMHKNNGNFTHKHLTSNTNNQDRYSSAQSNNDTYVSQTKRVDQLEINVTNTKDTFQQNQLRKYNNNGNTESRRNGYSSTSNAINPNNRNHSNGAISKTNPNKGRFDNGTVRGKCYNNDRNQPYQKSGFQSDKFASYNDKENLRQENITSSNNVAINDNFAFYEDTYLSKTEFTQVEIIAPLSDDEYWVYKTRDSSARVHLMKMVKDVAEKSRNVQPIIGNIYGVQRGTLWHRAIVTSLNPVKVNFIDFGNDEILNKGAAIKDIQDMTKIPKFVRKIRLIPGTSKKYKNMQCGDKIFIKMLFVDTDKTIVVEIQEQSRSSPSCTTEVKPKVLPNSTQNSIIQIPDILDAFGDLLAQKKLTKLEIVGYIQIHEIVQKNVYSATLCPQVHSNEIEMIFNHLQNECENIHESVNHNLIENLVCGKTQDGWYRGYVSICPTTPSALRIFAVEEARILSVNKIVPCPIQYQNICTFGVICEINYPTKIKAGETYQFKAFMNEHNHKQQSLQIEITIDSKVTTATVKSWKLVKSLIRTLSELKSGSKICLTNYQNQYNMFARSLDEAEVEYYNNIMQRVAQCARTAPHLSKPPNIGQIVIAPFCDGNSYRALVMETQDDKAKIIYIDFGNMEETDIKELQVLSDGLALQRTCSTKIFLKNVSQEVPMNKEVDLYLRNLIGKEVSLICTYEGVSFKDGVHLTMLTGESINDNISKLLIPEWKKEDYDDKTCYMLNDIEIANLGSVGDIVNAIVLTVKENGRRYMMSPLDVDLVTHITETMPALLKEYCEKTEYYIPRAEELCLALYEEAWYRAVCLNPRESNTTCEIFFVDYGNIDSVEHKNIRLMPKDFIVPEAMANICIVVNLAPMDKTGNYSLAVQQKLTELISAESVIKIKIVNCSGNGDYEVELPDIHDKLIKEGLI